MMCVRRTNDLPPLEQVCRAEIARAKTDGPMDEAPCAATQELTDARDVTLARRGLHPGCSAATSDLRA